MARQWLPIPLDTKLTKNVEESSIGTGMAAIENGYVNEQGHHSRFPQLTPFVGLGVSDGGRIYLYEWRGDLVAASSSGRFYLVTRNGIVNEHTEYVIPAKRRVVFASTEDELAMAAGAEIVRFAGDKTELLSKDAPLASHVAYIDTYIVANEINTGRFRHSTVGEAKVWNSLDVFAANGSPDNITAVMTTPYRELLLFGPKSIEQFERLSGGSFPFFRRWSVAEGLREPYMYAFADNGVFCLNQMIELVRFSGQSSSSVGDDLGKELEKIDDWTDAWIGGTGEKPLHIRGQKFMVLQAPRATNPYGTKGLTYLFDYRQKRFSNLYGWNAAKGVPDRWPGWSHWSIWGRHFVGGEGVIYELVA